MAPGVSYPSALGDGDIGAQVNVLDGIQELHAFLHGALEGFAAGDEAGAAGAFVDDGGGYGFFEVVGAGSAAAVEGLIAAVIFRELLLDDVRLDGHSEMVGLASEIGGEVIVLVLLKGVVAEIAPEDGGHAELVGLREGLADFHDLAAALVGAEIDGSAHG